MTHGRVASETWKLFRFHDRFQVTTRQRTSLYFFLLVSPGQRIINEEKKRQTVLSLSRSALRKWGYTVTIVFNPCESRRCPSASNHREKEERRKCCARHVAKTGPTRPFTHFSQLPPGYSHHFVVLRSSAFSSRHPLPRFSSGRS